MVFFTKRKQIKEEAGCIFREEEEEAARKREQISNELKKPVNPITIEIKNDSYHLINGFYFAWCVDGNLVLECKSQGYLILTLRGDWNKETIRKLGFDSPSYSVSQLYRPDKRKYSVWFEDERARFVTIPIESIVSCTEIGELTTINTITEVKFKTSKKADLKNKTVTKDTRKGVLRISDSAHGDYEIIINYFEFPQFKAMIEAYKNQNSTRKKSEENIKSPSEILKELKELLDLGIINEKEFEKKKEELLKRI